MTNLAGKTFISYKREQEAVAKALERSFHEHGIRTWRDKPDLGTDTTDRELRETIRGDSITDAVILVSEKVSESEPILKTEVPEIVEQDYQDSEFSFVIALCPSLNENDDKEENSGKLKKNGESEIAKNSIYEKAATILNRADTSGGNFSARNMKKIIGDGTSPACSDDVAKAVLKNHLAYLDENLPEDEPLQCSLDTRFTAHPQKPSIKIDWQHRFGDTLPSEDVWNNRFVPVLKSVITTIRESMPSRILEFRGKALLSASFALGFIVRSTTGIKTSWIQGRQYSDEQEEWDISVDPSESSVEIIHDPRGEMNGDAGVWVGLSNDVRAVSQKKSEHPKFGPTVELKPNEYGADIDASQASDIAIKFRQAVKEMNREHKYIEKIHLLMAVPVGLAFIMGRVVANSFPDIQLYELETAEGMKRYSRSALISDSS